MTSPRPGQRDKPSTWRRARRDLATPQGSSLASALLLCAIVAVVLDVIGGRFLSLPGSIVYPAIVIANLAILVVAGFRISAMNKQAAEARREVYRQKFETNLEAIKAWSQRRGSRAAGAAGSGLTYEDAGVSIDTKEAALSDVKEMARTALDLTAEELFSYQPHKRPCEWQTAERWERAWGQARIAARLLRERFGVTRVVVFGSLAHRDWFSPWSDIDLAAWGIPADQFYRAVAAITGISQDFRVNLVDPEDCRLSVRRSIEREGIDL